MNALFASGVGLLAVAAFLHSAGPAGTTPAPAPPPPASIAMEQALTVPSDVPPSFELGLLLDGQVRTLRMHISSVRGPHMRLLVPDEAGVLRDAVSAPPTTYRGYVEELTGSLVAGWLSRDGLNALILHGRESWYVEPLRDPARRELHVVGRSSDFAARLPMDGFCGTQPTLQDPLPGSPPTAGSADGSALTLTEFAYDADYRFYQNHGSDLTETQQAIEGIVNSISALYEYFLGIQYEISGAVVRTSSGADPYYNISTGGSIDALLNAFKVEWGQNQTGITRDLAYLFSGFTGFQQSPGVVGIAMIGGVCIMFPNVHYALNLDLASNWGNIGVASHEVGHLWSACHCDQSGCSAYSPDDCGVMQSGLGAFEFFFGEETSEQILGWVGTHSCFGSGTASAEPELSSASPREVQALEGGRVTLSGSDLQSVLYVQVGSTTLDLKDIAVVDSETVEFLSVPATALGSEDVSVIGPGGTSDSVTFEYVETSPPKLVCEDTLGPAVDPIYVAAGDVTWRFGGLVGKTAKVMLSLSSSTTTVGSFLVLSNPTLVDEETLVDPGIGTYTRNIPSGAVGLNFWMQVLLYDGSTLIDVSAIEMHYVAL